MYNLNAEEIMMVDGGGDGGYGEVIGCSIVGGVAAVGAGLVTKNSNIVSTVSSIVTGSCMVAAQGGNNGNQGGSTSNVGSGGYMGNGLQSGGGMMGSPTGGMGNGY
ncbi:hypothetical protein ATG66_2807 [Vibrio sp. ES.051]|uniref:hypothetical protein n=1 Tax=Vibrio sp. ES.051 TaxID=1761909 RepID=UPI000BF8FEAF|nr:hypothetical protein [Vibrio sp. ES.051]PFG56472.1 hypothetical protein ATG66_2807 [Vibrio sp. ES.051]